MRKRIATLFASVVLVFTLLPACGTTQGTTGGTAEQATYTESELTLHASDADAPKTLAVRFYDDLPSVPYFGLAQYLSVVFGDNATVKVDGGTATITTTDGGVAVVDDAADTLTSDSWATFHNYVEPMQEGKMQGFIDFATPFVRVASLDYEEQTKPVVFDFAKYNIDVHVDQNDAYLPLATISDFMADVAMTNLAYNGKDLCLTSGYLDAADQIDPDWYTAMATDEPRTQDMTDFAYNELCFAIDTLYSCSGKCAIDEDLKAKGLDATLDQRDDLTRRVKELLTSTDKVDYALGLYFFGLLVFNGHTAMEDTSYISAFSGLDGITDRATQIEEELWKQLEDLGYMEAIQALSDSLMATSAQNQRDAIWTDGATYHEQGDTAVITINSFMDYDREGWDAFYAGKGERPDGSTVADIVGTLISGLERAKANPQIKNVVLDVTTNGGGSNDLCAASLALLTGQATTPAHDLISDQHYTITYDVDTLFDGSFDTAAFAKKYDFRYAVMTTSGSFSCGNYLPSLLRDAGIPVIGEVSGGGTDMVARLITPEGMFLTVTDAFAEMTDAEGNQIENGVPVDVELVKVAEDGTKDYSDCYDIAKLSEVVNKLYDEREALPEAA